MLSDTRIKRDVKYPLPIRFMNRLKKMSSKSGRKKINAYIKETLGDKEFTLFTNNCFGGVFYNDAGRQFTTPTVNLAFDGEDYIKFLENPQKYLNGEMKFIEVDQVSYPVCQIDDIEIRFVHYKTPEECEQTWKRRAGRIVWDNLFIMATDHDGMKSPDLLKRFDQLPYKHKIMFTSEEYPEYDWAICVPQFKGRFQVRIMTNFADFKGHRYYETCFDIAKWIAESK